MKVFINLHIDSPMRSMLIDEYAYRLALVVGISRMFLPIHLYDGLFLLILFFFLVGKKKKKKLPA